MYVQCERCQAEYEFDDALVSERGTTVKCTSCGHQFKIKRASGAGAGDGDRWMVTTNDGRSLVFSSLKELQRAIVAKTVARNDQLSRAGSAPKALGSIAELEPFFEERRARNPSVPDNRPMLATSSRPPPPLPMPMGSLSAPIPSQSGNTIPAPGGPSIGLQPPRQKMRSQPSIPPPLPPRANSRAPSAPGPLAPMPKADGPWSGDDTPTHALIRDAAAAVPPVASKKDEPKPEAKDAAAAPAKKEEPKAAESGRGRSIDPPPPRPKPAPAVDRTEPLPPMTSERPARISASDALRGPSPSMYDSSQGGRRMGGWIVGLVLLGGVSAVGFFMMSRARTQQATETQTATDPRVATFLSAGESALAQGNLDLAKENFDKASALAEKNPDVLLAVARLAASRADLAWLRQKLLVDGSDDARVNKQQLDDLAAAARKAAEDAQKGAPDNAALVRARIDALRISGDTKSARDLVDKILPTGSQPETAYVLAALDLAEKDPPWSVVLSRLRTAAAGEGTASRARAALVVALAQSGDGAEARRELDRLAAQPRVHPLLPTLRAFLDRTAPATAAGKDAGAAVAAVDVKNLPPTTTPTAPTTPTVTTTPTGATGTPTTPTTPTTPKNPETSGGGSTGGGTAGLPSDPRTLIRMAEAAKGKRDLDRAKTLYEAALAKNAGDSEALAGLGDVLRSQGDTSGAQSYYKRALAVNPSYLPALIGLADVQWDGGDKAGAQKAYRDIVDRFPEPAYPARVKQRAEGGG